MLGTCSPAFPQQAFRKRQLRRLDCDKSLQSNGLLGRISGASAFFLCQRYELKRWQSDLSAAVTERLHCWHSITATTTRAKWRVHIAAALQV